MRKKNSVDPTNSADTTTLLREVFEELAVKTDSGTVLEGSTLQAVEQAVDAWLYYQRTGVEVMEIASRLPVKKIAERAGCEVTDKRKIMSQFEKEYDEWLKNRPASGSFGAPAIDPDFAKSAKSNLHKLLKSAGNALDINGLAVGYCFQTEKAPTADNVEFVRGQIRAYILTDHAFSIGRGGMAKVYRVTDDKGKATGVEVSESSPAGGKGNKTPERFSSNVQALGFTSKAQWQRAKQEGHHTYEQLRAWLSKHKNS